MIDPGLPDRKAFYLESAGGYRFAIATLPGGDPKGAWLFVHPFAEEMNKSRRMVSLGAYALAQRGYLVLQLDHGGCGDSAGDFGDADWDGWLSDISCAWNWLGEHCSANIGLWTLRSGCLLASDWIARHNERPPLLLWQPVRSGEQHLTQFLRLKAANEMLSGGSKGVLPALRAELDAGRPVEIAGYALSPSVAAGLASCKLRLPADYEEQVIILETVHSENPEPTPAIRMLADSWSSDGIRVTTSTINGPSFWQTVEIETAPDLIEATLNALDSAL